MCSISDFTEDPIFGSKAEKNCMREEYGMCTHHNCILNLVSRQVFSGLLVGAMLPYWFSAMTMKSVGKAALAMVEEVRRQFNEIPGLMEGTARPDYRRCVEISTSVRP